MSRDIGRRRHQRRSGSTRHETDAATRSQLGRSDPLVLRRQRSDLAESTRSASQIPRAEARATSLPQSLEPWRVPISCSGERPWAPRARNQRLRSDQIAIAPVAPACPNCRDFVPWRFSDADRPRVGRAQHLGVRETCTSTDSCSAQVFCARRQLAATGCAKLNMMGGVAAWVAPRVTNTAARPAVRFHTVRRWPCASRRSAMALPIAPRPHGTARPQRAQSAERTGGTVARAARLKRRCASGRVSCCRCCCR